jgi:hypothetical protein
MAREIRISQRYVGGIPGYESAHHRGKEEGSKVRQARNQTVAPEAPDGERSGQVFSRRRALMLGGAAAGGVLASAGPLSGIASASTTTKRLTSATRGKSPKDLPVKEIERIIRAQGTFSNGVLNIEIDRTDLPHVVKEGHVIKPAFMINGNLCFEQLHDGSVMMNGDLGFKPEEINPAIGQMVRHGVIWQALHQHLYGLDPMVYFMHMRIRGTARKVAEACAAVLSATSTPLPQAPPKNPTTPLDAKRLGRIIGSTPTVGASGVVAFSIPSREQIVLGNVPINPYLNVYTSVDFQPIGGNRAIVVPDFGQHWYEVDTLAKTMLAQGWQIDCLYNQETAEDPQLFFSHHYKVGDAYKLAAEVRRGLDTLELKLDN